MSLLTETVRVTGIVAILFLTGTLRVFYRHGRAIHGNLFEVFVRALFALSAFAVILTADSRLNGGADTVGESLILAIVWGVFVALLPAAIVPWVRARRFPSIHADVRRAFTSTMQMSLSTGLLTWVFLVLTDRSGRLLDLRLDIAALIAVIGALQLARLAQVPLLTSHAPPDHVAPGPSSTPLPDTIDEVTTGV
ncbi:MAG: hypothetical protein WAM81_11850 [Acidimicrobiia bacterium]